MAVLTMEMLQTTSMKKIFNFELHKVKRQDKDDVYQQCVYNILKSLSRLSKKGESVSEEKFPSFCQTIIKRTVVDYYRSTNRMIDKATKTVNFSDARDDDDSSDTSPDDAYTHQCDSWKVAQRYQELQMDYEYNRNRFNERDQQILDYILYRGLGKQFNEIAQELNVDKTVTSRAVRRLRDIVTAV